MRGVDDWRVGGAEAGDGVKWIKLAAMAEAWLTLYRSTPWPTRSATIQIVS